MKSLLIALIGVSLLSSGLNAEKMRVAVSEFKAIGIPQNTAGTITELIRTELSNVKQFQVLERGQMDSILREQGFQQAGCTDTECAVQMGKMVSARKILVGTVTKLGNNIVINGRFVDVEKAVSEIGVTEKADKEDELYDTVKRFTVQAARRYIHTSGEYDAIAAESAFNPENHDFVIRLGYDVYATHNYTRNDIGEVETDLDRGPRGSFSLNLEYYYLLRPYFNIGVGLSVQAPREVSDRSTAKFSIVPVYGSIRIPWEINGIKIYAIGNLGYTNWGDTQDYTAKRGGTEPSYKGGDLKPGLYYGAGLGVILFGSWVVQAQYEIFESEIQTHDNSWPLPQSITDSAKYSRIMVSAGIVF